MINRTLFINIDWILICLLVINSLIGVAIIYSSSHYLPGNYFLRQIFWIIVSLGALLLFLSIDYIVLITYSLYFYLFFLAILSGILVFGHGVAGARSWIKLPFFQIQPSELIKIAIILLLTQLFTEFKKRTVTWKKGFTSITFIIIPCFLVSLQPDLGTAFSYSFILMAALILAGLNRKTLVVLLIFAFIIGIIGWDFFLRDYQKKRLKTLIFPSEDPLGAGYHIIQSKIAIGSGGFLGKGYKRGTQSQLRFLPARHTDFIFSVIAEEFGFLGIIGALLFYFLLIFRLFQSVLKSRDRAGVYITFMVSLMIAAQFFVNVFMTIGLFPVTGIPLPLLSYGGSSLLTTYLAVSLVLNVKMRRFVNV